jgi:endonuclease III
MNLFELLQNNKGTVSSALGKELAQKVLEGDRTILNDAIQYVSYDLENPKSKNIRAGAAKILEKVAEKQPGLIADDLGKLKPALDTKEPQTRWMLMQVFGFCAKLNPKVASSVIDYGKAYLGENAGVCLSGAVHLYLGRVGATSEKNGCRSVTNSR